MKRGKDAVSQRAGKLPDHHCNHDDRRHAATVRVARAQRADLHGYALHAQPVLAKLRRGDRVRRGHTSRGQDPRSNRPLQLDAGTRRHERALLRRVHTPTVVTRVDVVHQLPPTDGNHPRVGRVRPCRAKDLLVHGPVHGHRPVRDHALDRQGHLPR